MPWTIVGRARDVAARADRRSGRRTFCRAMVTVTAETSSSSSLDDAWAALGRRAAFFYFPGVSRSPSGATLDHALDLPIVDRQEQVATLRIDRPSRPPPPAGGGQGAGGHRARAASP